MGKSHLKSKFLSVDPPATSRAAYRNTLVWRWLQFVVAGADGIGDVIRTLRKRKDMPNEFPHKTYLLQTYLIRRCRVDPAVAVRVHERLWDLYAQYRDAEKHNATFEPIKRGVTRNPWAGQEVEDDKTTKWLSR